MRRAYLVSLALLASGARARGQTPDPVHRAEAAFGSLHFEEALTLYEAAQQTAPSSAWLDFNVGTSALAAGKMGPAVLHLRRAQLRAPRAEGIRHNLAVARDRRQDAVDDAEISPQRQLAEATLGRFSETERWLIFGLVMGLVLLSLRPRRRVAPWLRWGATAIASAAGIGILFATWGLAALSARSYVVVAEEVVVRASTHPDSLVRFRLHPGAEVEVLAQNAAWVRIRLDARRDGWTTRQGLSKVVQDENL